MKSGNLSERDQKILAHIGRYGFTCQEILQYLFLDGSNPQKTLDDLRRGGYIESFKGFGGNRAGYKLKTKATSRLGIPRSRANAPGSDAKPTHLAILCYCLLNGRPRIPLEESELKELFEGTLPPGDNHCLERSRAACRIDHVYVPAESTSPKDIVITVRKHLMAAMELHTLRPWIRYRLYGFAILVESATRVEQVNRELDRLNYVDTVPIRQVAFIHVEKIPRTDELEEALRGLAQAT